MAIGFCKTTRKWRFVWGVLVLSGVFGCTAGVERKEVSEVRVAKAVQTEATAHSNGSNGWRKAVFLPTAMAAQEAQPEQESSEAEPQAENALPVPPTAPPPTVVRDDRVSLNFNHADLVEVIHVLAQHLTLNYTIDPNVKGTVTIHSAEPLKKEDLLPIFHQLLRMNNAVAVKTGGLYRIVPIKDGMGLARPVTRGTEDSYALQVVPVRFFSVGEMKRLLTPFVTPGGEILDYPRGNFLIIMDLPSNIQRLIEIKDLIDINVFSGVRMEIYQPKVASAEELAEEMTKIMQVYASSLAQAEGFAAQFLPLPRINQLLIIGHSEAAWTYVQRWLERIDVVAEGPGKRIFIYPVENSKAGDLADVLNEVLGLSSPGRRGTRPTLQELHRATRPTSSTPGGSPFSGFGGSSMSTTPQTSGQGAFAVVPRTQEEPQAGAVPPTTPRRSPGPTQRPAEEDQMRVVADPATNSLIIFGTAQEFQNIKNILKDLDIIPRQVLMEVLVAEVTLTDDMSFGIEYEILRKTKDDSFSSDFGPIPVQIGESVGGITGLIGTGGQIRALINALMTDSRVKILASPHILATDNRPARIQVGSEEPIPTGVVEAATGATDSLSTSTTIQFRNTGRIVTIIPQVNAKGLVNLQIKAEVSERGATSVRVGNQDFPSFTTRDAETTAVVQDGETLVLGGLISETKSRGRTGIPYLMDIPVLGRFFGTTDDSVNRTELVMLITPRVIRNVDEGRIVTEEFKEKVSTIAREIERMRRETPRPPVKETLPEEKTEKENVPQEPSPAVPEPQSKKSPQDRPTSQGTSEGAARAPAQRINHTHPTDKTRHIESSTRSAERNKRESSADLLQDRPVLTLAASGKVEKETSQVRWSVQVSAFTDEKSSLEAVKKLRERGYNAYTVKANIKGRTWYRVRVGRLATPEQANVLRRALAEKENYSDAFISSR